MSVISRIVDNKRKLLHLFCLEIVISGTARREIVKLDVSCAWIVCIFYKQFLRPFQVLVQIFQFSKFARSSVNFHAKTRIPPSPTQKSTVFTRILLVRHLLQISRNLESWKRPRNCRRRSCIPDFFSTFRIPRTFQDAHELCVQIFQNKIPLQ